MLLLYLEPLFATAGAFLLLISPETYTSDMTRRTIATVDPKSHFLFQQLAGGWLHLAFTEAVVLRLVDDMRVWRLLCMGILVSDILYCHSMAQGVGGWAVWIKVWDWTLKEWIATVTTWPFVLARCAIVSGIGMKSSAPKGARAKKSD